MLKKSDQMLAIDLAPDAVRVLNVSFRNGAPFVSTVATGDLAAGGVESLPERHLAALESLISTHRLRTRQCVAAVPTNLVVTRSVTIDPSKAQPPEEQIRVVLANCLPGDSRDLLFDFWPVGDTASKNRTHEVLVVATQGAVIQRYLKGLTKLRLTCVHLDVAPCAIASLIARLIPDQDSMIGTIALTDSQGYFAVVDKQRVLFWRPFELPAGGVRAGIAPALERVGDEISKCVSHMVGALHLEGMTEIFAFGQGVQDESFAAYLMTRFNLQVRALSPFESLPGDALPGELRSSLEPASATHYATALGLAHQSAGGFING